MGETPVQRRLYRGELARRAGCHLETIRYYERSGLLPEPPRTAARYRLYDAGHLARLRFILRARALGFSLAEIGGLLALVDAGKPSCSAVKARTEAHLAEVRAKIADLRRIECILAETVQRCPGDESPDCPILKTLEGDDGAPTGSPARRA